MNFYAVIALAAAAISADAATNVDWLSAAPTNQVIEPTMEEVELRRFERWITERLTVREYGRFDMLAQRNGRLLRWGTTLVPRELEIMLHILSSPVLHNSLFRSMTVPEGILPHFQILGLPLKLPEGGAAHSLAIAALRNDLHELQQYQPFKPTNTTWPTYLDNEAAYTYMWRALSYQVKVKRRHIKDKGKLSRNMLKYCYRNEQNELLIFKFDVELDKDKHYNFAALISHWSLHKLPVNEKYVEILDEMLAKTDRTQYAEGLFDNLGHYSRYKIHQGNTATPHSDIMALPLLKSTLTLDQSLDAEARRIAKITIKLAYHLMVRMLEKHAIPAFTALRQRRRSRRTYGVLGPLRYIRSLINIYRDNYPPNSINEVNPSPQEAEQIEEMLFESSKNFQPYWSMKNDTLYNKSPDIVPPDVIQTLGLLFDPERLLRRLLNIRGDPIDFQEVHDILHRVTAPETQVTSSVMFKTPDTCRAVHSMPEKVEQQYLSLSASVREKLMTKCRCLLAFLYLFGVTDRSGRPQFPWGWPRNIGNSLTYITEGIGASCGVCNAVLGFLSGIGYPPVVNNMYAWEMRKTHVESAVYQMLVTSKRSIRKRHTEYFDKTLLSYLSGHYKDDDASSLAVSYYLYSGIGNPSRILDDPHVTSGIERQPKAIGSKCIDALPYVIDAAKSAMRTRSNINQDEGSEEYRSQRYAEFVKKLAVMGDLDGLRVMGDFHFMGHEAGNIEVNVPRALEYWTMAAQNGDVTSALTMANHLIQILHQTEESDVANSREATPDDVMVTAEQLHLEGTERADIERAAERYLNTAARSNNPLAASTARFYMTRYGIGHERDPVAAARYLQESADRGDVTSQILMGHAYAGMLDDITPPDGKNVFMALDYYRRAAKNGNIVATFNTAVLTLHGYDLKFSSSVDRCKAAFALFQKVGRHALVPAVARTLAKRASLYGDEIGHALLSMFLSEMGDPEAHIAAARHFKTSNKLCYIDDLGLQQEVPDSDDVMSTVPSTTQNGVPGVESYMDSDISDYIDAKLNTKEGSIFHAVTQDTDPSGTSPCHLFYARRSGYETNGGSPLLLAEALLDRDPRQSAEWMLEAKLRNEHKATYLYATMLEAGVGVVQDCTASYGYYHSMTESKEHLNKLLGFLCIQRARVSSILHEWRNLYNWFVSTFYDIAIVPNLLADDYVPCGFTMPKVQPLRTAREFIVTSFFVAVIGFSTIVYIKIR
ncbi:uncharacterized protein BXIN_2781 [Babesia sp. Xinjiang]|uniref:uncharacterized protein n=1 Tax=Babesia sp. Xinjiang TaxID=462227 RepID=UPI000A23D325|nr:uncharacterized protein BXIN_2781 [Babesia sp. Xinjiang]ORM41743.1 hypothetical protein BXIN_2781 [Babesia sp. Xinjiang]